MKKTQENREKLPQKHDGEWEMKEERGERR
jgi:hypothetical protein